MNGNKILQRNVKWNSLHRKFISVDLKARQQTKLIRDMMCNDINFYNNFLNAKNQLRWIWQHAPWHRECFALDQSKWQRENLWNLNLWWWKKLERKSLCGAYPLLKLKHVIKFDWWYTENFVSHKESKSI